MANPFTPSFGVSPPLLAGRDWLIDEFAEAIDDGPGASARATLYTGARGSGKTVMLNAVEDRARAAGWLVISETATAGFIDRITRQHLPGLLASFDPDAVVRRMTGITGPFGTGGLSWTSIASHVADAGLRNQIDGLTHLLAANGTGLLITLDEIHHNRRAELRELATTIQHGFREGRELAFVGAGLTSAISDVLNDSVLTFLRRADRHTLGRVADADVRKALAEPIEAAGRRIGDEALGVMTAGAQGYPFLIQLVGARAWRQHPTALEVTVADARVGVAEAASRVGRLLHEPALRAASEVGMAFLRAMAVDDGPSRMSDVAGRLEVSDNYASQYRLRLIAGELIEAPRRGYVAFALPYLRDYLLHHPDSPS